MSVVIGLSNYFRIENRSIKMLCLRLGKKCFNLQLCAKNGTVFSISLSKFQSHYSVNFKYFYAYHILYFRFRINRVPVDVSL